MIVSGRCSILRLGWPSFWLSHRSSSRESQNDIARHKKGLARMELTPVCETGIRFARLRSNNCARQGSERNLLKRFWMPCDQIVLSWHLMDSLIQRGSRMEASVSMNRTIAPISLGGMCWNALIRSTISEVWNMTEALAHWLPQSCFL